MCAFALRFVFPSFSVEKKTLWILESAPLTFRKIFLSKYAFYTSLFLVVGLLMEYINILILRVSFISASYSLFLFISAIIFIITLALSMGAIFPSQDSDDPEAVSTSMSGLFFTALSLLYGAISTFILYKVLLGSSTVELVVLVSLTLSLLAFLLWFVPYKKRVLFTRTFR